MPHLTSEKLTLKIEEILLNMHAYLCYCKVCETNFTKKASALAIPILSILVVR